MAQYNAYWFEFCQFCTEIGVISFPASRKTIQLFVVYLRLNHLRANSIKSRLCAVAEKHKLADVRDPTKSYTVKRLLSGYLKGDGPAFLRRPIDACLLTLIFDNLHLVTTHTFLFKALFSLMYHGSMRIGEVSKSRTTKHTLTYNDILFTAEGDLAINFKTFKHSNGSESIILKQNVNSNICPVLTLQNYLQHRPPSSGDPSQNFLFQYPDGEVISRSFVTNILKKTINTLGLNSKDFNCHSFRIGHTTDLFNANFPDYYIRRSGRWKSDAWKVYVKSALVVW